MATCDVANKEKRKSASVGMGQHCFGQAPDSFSAVLGSCIGVSLYHPPTRRGALVHIVLPAAHGRSGLVGKYADTAIPYLLGLFKQEYIPSRQLIAKLAGGATMFGGKGPIQIGAQNQTAIRDQLAQANIHIASDHLEGAKGRRIVFDCSTGLLRVEVAGEKVVEL